MNDISPCDRLDHFTKTFRRDQEYFDALTSSPDFPVVAKAIVFSKWAHEHFEVLQGALDEQVAIRFPNAPAETVGFWTLALTGQIVRDIGLVSYLLVRGLTAEAGIPVRRALENIGVLSHLWREPAKAEALGPIEGKPYRDAFLRECHRKKQDDLAARNISKRFANFPEAWAQKATQLYNILSAFNVHGGAPHGLVLAELEPTRFSCGFYNRPSLEQPDKGRMILTMVMGIEIVLIELCSLVGAYGTKEARVREAALTFVALLGSATVSSAPLHEEIESVMKDILGVQESEEENIP